MQMVMAGFVLGAQAAPGLEPGIFCAAVTPDSPASDSGTGDDHSRAGHPDCCRQGCPMLGALGLGPSELAVSVVRFAVAVVPSRDVGPAMPALWKDPGKVRGPPATA
ncbi:MAG: hypothetical protein B7Y75_00565 [Azorhizobium sp. 35-67-5]|nr:MAG: hypothetical protein B7Y75_00565 [Azorhizobium sp. 35-67-5]